jgi:hypothetical protein
MPPTKTTFADGWDGSDWRKLAAAVTILGIGIKMYRSSKVSVSDLVTGTLAIITLFRES